MIGATELILIIIAAFLMFGGEDAAKIGKKIGKVVKEMRNFRL